MVSHKLLSLAEREYKQSRAAPAPKTFRAMNLNAGRFDESWDRKRGSAVRMMTVILRQSDQSLRARVTETPDATRTYESAAYWFRSESEHLRKTAALLDTASNRILQVLDAPIPQEPALANS